MCIHHSQPMKVKATEFNSTTDPATAQRKRYLNATLIQRMLYKNCVGVFTAQQTLTSHRTRHQRAFRTKYLQFRTVDRSAKHTRHLRSKLNARAFKKNQATAGAETSKSAAHHTRYSKDGQRRRPSPKAEITKDAPLHG